MSNETSFVPRCNTRGGGVQWAAQYFMRVSRRRAEYNAFVRANRHALARTLRRSVGETLKRSTHVHLGENVGSSGLDPSLPCPVATTK